MKTQTVARFTILLLTALFCTGAFAQSTLEQARETNMTMLIVTHEMGFARDVADRVVFFDEGQVAEQGPPAQIFSEPKNPRTQSFLQAVLEH